MSVSVPGLEVSIAGPGDADGMVEVIHAAFGARPALDPPSTALSETPESVRRTLGRGGGIYATVGGRPAGVILINVADPGAERRRAGEAVASPEAFAVGAAAGGSGGRPPEWIRRRSGEAVASPEAFAVGAAAGGSGGRPPGVIAAFQRVSVHPAFQRHGIASAMVTAAEDYAAELGFRRVELFARTELAELIAFWHHRGFGFARTAPYGVFLAKSLPLMIMVPTADAMRRLGAALAAELRAGDLVIAAGDLGAGKTTLTQGIGAGLGSEGPIISPTFVLSRVHRSTTGRPDLVHVDAYRLTSAAELDDMDLDTAAPDAITVVEWGAGLAEGLATDRLEIGIHAAPEPSYVGNGDAQGDDHQRMVVIRPVGRRWHHVDLEPLRDAIMDGVQ